LFTSVLCPTCGYAAEASKFINGCPICGYVGPVDAPGVPAAPTHAGPLVEALPLWVWFTAVALLLAALAALISILR
jgi:hypothetical protein